MKYLLTFNDKSDFIYEDIDYDFIVESKNEIEYRGELFPGYNKPKRYKGAGKYKFRGFRKRHKCDPVKNLDKTTARYWACQYLW